MTVSEYQQAARQTASYPAYAHVLYPVLGVAGEAGELVAKFHDALWPSGSPVPDEQESIRDALLAFVGAANRCETLKKMIRGGRINLTGWQKAALAERVEQAVGEGLSDRLANESSDLAWYVSALLTDLGLSLDDALANNLLKLQARQQKGQIHDHLPDSQDHKEQQ